MGTKRAPRPGRDIGALVRARRHTMRLTQREFAELAGLSIGTLRDLEQGRTHLPAAQSVMRLARVLAVGTEARGRKPARPHAEPTQPGPASGTTRQMAKPASVMLQILGPLAAWRDGRQIALGGPKQRAVLGLLALEANLWVRREALVDAIWGEDCPATVTTVVQEYVSRLRQLLDAGRRPRDTSGLLVSAGTSYRLQARPGQLDLLDFRQLIDRAHAAAASGDQFTAYDLYQQALQLWQAEPLTDLGLLRAHPSITGLIRLHAAVVAEFAQTGLALGLHRQILPALQQLVARDPLNETAHVQLMLALAHTGQQAAALQLFEEIRHRLDTQLGVRPGPGLCDVHLQLLRGAAYPAKTVPPQPARRPTRQPLPLRGLPVPR